MMQDYLHNVLETKSEKLEAIRKIVLEQIPSDKRLYTISVKNGSQESNIHSPWI